VKALGLKPLGASIDANRASGSGRMVSAPTPAIRQELRSNWPAVSSRNRWTQSSYPKGGPKETVA
jgi:hypothetical protein